jgi:hypothetical protein
MKLLKSNIKAPLRVRKYSNGGSAPTDPPSEFEKFLAYTIKKKGGTAEQYNDLMDAIAFHETGPHQRMKANAVQLIEVDGKIMPGGPGRGMFMFESGDDAGGITAINRTYKEFKDAGLDIPEFLSEAYKKTSIDMSELTADQQKIVFLGNYLQHPKANFSDVVNGKQTYDEFWFNYHQAGGDDVKEARLSAFQESQKARSKKD